MLRSLIDLASRVLAQHHRSAETADSGQDPILHLWLLVSDSQRSNSSVPHKVRSVAAVPINEEN